MDTIKDLRGHAHVLSILTNNFISFHPKRWCVLPEKSPEMMNRKHFPMKSDVRRVICNYSQGYSFLPYHWIVKTDKGVFRYASDDDDFWEYAAPSIDLKSERVNRAVDSLMMAKAWMGKILGELGYDTPYQNDGNRHNVKDIEPEADTKKNKNLYIAKDEDGEYRVERDYISDHLEEANDVEKLDFLRQDIGRLKNNLSGVKNRIENPSDECNLAFTNAYSHLSEARFWLGFELGVVRELN